MKNLDEKIKKSWKVFLNSKPLDKITSRRITSGFTLEKNGESVSQFFALKTFNPYCWFEYIIVPGKNVFYLTVRSFSCSLRFQFSFQLININGTSSYTKDKCEHFNKNCHKKVQHFNVYF